MEAFSAILALCTGNSSVTGEFPSQRPVTLSFDVFFHLCLNKRLSKQPWCWWFETPSHSLWRHCNVKWEIETVRDRDKTMYITHVKEAISLELRESYDCSYGSESTLKNFVNSWLTTMLLWCHNERDGVSNHRCQDSLLNRLFRRRSKKISKVSVTGLCEGNSPVTGEVPTQRASNAKNVSIWWRHHERPMHISWQSMYTTLYKGVIAWHMWPTEFWVMPSQ